MCFFLYFQVFSPSEKLDNPVALHLVFCQVIKDVASSACIRMNREEKRKLQQLIGNIPWVSNIDVYHFNPIKDQPSVGTRSNLTGIPTA